jgi:hypothetical protein
VDHCGELDPGVYTGQCSRHTRLLTVSAGLGVVCSRCEVFRLLHNLQVESLLFLCLVTESAAAAGCGAVGR